jgi:hypothetical protein
MTGPKTLPTIWYTYMMLVTKYQISAINSYWEKGDEKCEYIRQIPTSCMPTLLIFKHIWTYILYMPIFSRIFLSNYWW